MCLCDIKYLNENFTENYIYVSESAFHSYKEHRYLNKFNLQIILDSGMF